MLNEKCFSSDSNVFPQFYFVFFQQGPSDSTTLVCGFNLTGVRVFLFRHLPHSLLQVCAVIIEVMDEQTGSPGANTENNSQKNGDEVKAEPVDIE